MGSDEACARDNDPQARRRGYDGPLGVLFARQLDAGLRRIRRPWGQMEKLAETLGHAREEADKNDCHERPGRVGRLLAGRTIVGCERRKP